ncbi:Diacylglycerol kinase 1 [Lucilia cuprina]|nr:Diacylglycerol kinase 1 [Lucilia cuprina]
MPPICVKFHLEREKNPHKFNSRMKNKLCILNMQIETFAASCKNLHEHIENCCKYENCEAFSLDLANGPHLQGVALLNIPYTMALKSSDKELSATSFNSVAFISRYSSAYVLRASGRRLAQCSEVVIKTPKLFPCKSM